MVVALENIRSLYNVGAILRTASFFGVNTVLLVGYTGRIKTNIDRLHPKVVKTALGAEKDLDIKFLADSKTLIRFAADRRLVAIEQHAHSVPLSQWQPETSDILVFGNEIEGVSQTVLKTANTIVEIKRLGKKSSLNVAIAAGIVLARLAAR